jgi:DNA-binding transcriptional ArsR family regulator
MNVSNPINLTDGQALELAETFRLLGDPSRLRILALCLGQPVCVSDIAERLELSQSLVSHHLRLLRMARAVRAERHGRQMFYQAADDHIRCVIADMAAHLDESIADDHAEQAE